MFGRHLLRSRQVIQILSLKSLTPTSAALHTLPHRLGVAPSFASRTSIALIKQRQVRCYSSADDGTIFSIESEEDFNAKVINSESPVLVDFYADWCGPCKMLGPRLEAKVSGRDGLVHLGKVNVDDVAELVDDFQISAVPTIIVFKHGEVVARFEGAPEDSQLDAMLDELTEVE